MKAKGLSQILRAMEVIQVTRAVGGCYEALVERKAQVKHENKVQKIPQEI